MRQVVLDSAVSRPAPNTKKTTVITDDKGRTVWTGAIRPGRQHDQTALKIEGIDDLFDQWPTVKVKVDAGYRGLAKAHPGQVQAPPLKLGKGASPEDLARWESDRKPREDPPRDRRPGVRPSRRTLKNRQPARPARPDLKSRTKS